MTIKGLANAMTVAKDRAKRTKQSICIVNVGQDEYILWRENTLALLKQEYPDTKVVMIIRVG